MDSAFKGKKVFVTGADGFIGSHLVEKLVKIGADVRALVFYNSWNNIGWLADLEDSFQKEIEIFHGDIRDSERVNEGVANCDYVFHLSSLIAIPYSYQAPRSYFETNVSGALNVAEACKANSRLLKLVHISTSEVYGTARQVPIPESHPLVAQSPYSASKIAADKLIESFALSFDLPVVTARPFNTFGPRQTARAVIPTVASQLIAGTKTLKIGDTSPTRDFVFVSDTIDALLQLATSNKAVGEVVNVGTGEEWSIRELIDILSNITNKKIEVEIEDSRKRPEKSEVHRLLADTTKLKQITNWERKVSFEAGLTSTVQWIEKNIKHFDAWTYTK